MSIYLFLSFSARTIICLTVKKLHSNYFEKEADRSTWTIHACTINKEARSLRNNKNLLLFLCVV
jgi:hypothetical protein